MTRVDSEILTVEDLAKLFSCDKETAAARLTSGDLPGVKVGRSWIIPRQALFERLNEKAREEAATRRSYLDTARNSALRKGSVMEEKTIEESSVRQLSGLTHTSSRQRGRTRRTPPQLPSLPEFTDMQQVK
ncbi:helix-turn-helix domain-containing protein [Delftia sp. WSY_7]|uniref:helix-turn-helix domain-containing protein n=1 Tax=Delftia sp. WSY_7 TaxID=3367202 RepID=UPI00370A4503